jgi:hypothetical protein
MDFIDGRDIDAPLFLAIAIVAGPALFWSFIGLGYGMSALSVRSSAAASLSSRPKSPLAAHIAPMSEYGGGSPGRPPRLESYLCRSPENADVCWI